MTDSTYNFRSHGLHVPPLEEVASLFQEQLVTQFAEVHVSVEECPDLRSKPFSLAGSGLSGRTSVCDVGGVPYLVPLAKTDRPPYSMKQISKLLGYSESFMLGAACGPFRAIGTNCELMPNISLRSTPEGVKVVQNETHVAKLEKNEKGYSLSKIVNNSEFCLLGNLFASEGKPGRVVKVRVKKRLGKENFVTILREILKAKYGEKHVALGGVFLIKSGKAKIHIMPDFSKSPLKSDDEVNNWLKYFEMSAPLVCLSVFHSTDPGHDLRIEHTHCFSNHGDGGHYHYDTTPDEVEYEAYFNTAEQLHRIDAPQETHNIGRD